MRASDNGRLFVIGLLTNLRAITTSEEAWVETNPGYMKSKHPQKITLDPTTRFSDIPFCVSAF